MPLASVRRFPQRDDVSARPIADLEIAHHGFRGHLDFAYVGMNVDFPQLTVDAAEAAGRVNVEQANSQRQSHAPRSDRPINR